MPAPIKLLILSVLVGGTPVFSVLLAGLVAKANSCELHEGFVNPCVIFGVDLGGMLYSMGVFGWFMLISLPIGILGALASILWWGIWKVRRGSR